MSNPYAEPQSHTHCQLLGQRFSRTTLRNSLRLTLFAFAVSLVLYFSPRASAVNRTWDGGGTTNNWSEAANWSGDTAPGAGDIAVFDGTSTKDATIDTNFSVQGVQLNAGYTGTVTQAAGIQFTVGSSNYSQSAGTFTGGSGDIDINGVFTLSGGTFTASSGVSSFDHFSHTAGGTFLHNNGTVTFDNPAVNPQITNSNPFNNLNLSAPGRAYLIFADLVVEGSFALNTGDIRGASIEARGNVTISPNSGGNGGVNNATLILRNSLVGPRTINLAPLANPVDNLPRITVADAAVTINTTGPGTLKWLNLTLQAGTINQGDVAFAFGEFYNQSGGTFNASSNPLTFNSSFTVSGGAFNGGSGNLDVNGGQSFTLSGGTFTASSGTMSFDGTFTHNTGGTFLHNNGTVVFDSLGGPGIANSDPFHNLTFASGTNFVGTLVVLNSLSLNGGSIHSGTVEARGPVTVGVGFGGGSGTLLLANGGGPRTITFAAGASLPNVNLNDAGVTLQTSGSGTLNWIALTLQAGTINQGGVSFAFSNFYTQSGGAFNASSGSLTFNHEFTVSGGAFNGGSGNIDGQSFTLLGGTFTASSGTMSFHGNFNHNAGGTFLHNNGTVIFDSAGGPGISNTDPFNNLTFDGAGGKFIGALVVQGVLSLNDGDIRSGSVAVSGNLVVGASFDGGNASLTFTGAANQTYANGGGANPIGAWTINKTSGTVTLASNLILSSGQPLNITSGTLDQGASFNLQTSNTLTLGVTGVLRNFGGGNLTLGGDVSNSGIINFNGGGTACGDPGADALQIRSTAATTVRTWSGNGTFSLVDVDVDSQAASTPPGTITAFGSSVLGPNMGAGWTTDPADPDDCPLEINSQPSNQTACLGGSASFSVGASGSGLSFQWRRNGTPLSSGGNISIVSGPNSSTLTIDPVGAGDAASYDVVVTSSLGLTATSNPATLSFLSPPVITSNPGDTNVCAGATASFTAAASGNPTPTVQWQESVDGGANFNDITGATSTTLSFTASASQNGNKYRAVFTNSCSSATTTAATLTVNPPDLAIDKSHAGDFTVGVNGSYTLTVTNAGSCSTTGTITVTDTLPNGLSFVSGTGTGWSCSASGQDVTCTNVGPLAASASTVITLTVGVAQAAVPEVTNTASVSTPNDGNAANNSDSDPTTVNSAAPPINPGQLIISEFRVRGPNGASDEFVEIYNNTDSNITVQATDGSTGFALVASDGVARFVIPNTTLIPARGHFLGVNSSGYSLGSYPGGNAPASAKGLHQRPQSEPRPGADGSWDLSEDTVTVGGPTPSLTPTATGDVAYTTDILDNSGIALFNTANPANFTLTNRLDAVGSVSETNPLYKEGSGHPNLNPDLLPAETEYSWVRRLPGGCTGTDPSGFNNNCNTPTLVQNTAPSSLGQSQDTNDNAADFLFVSTTGGTGAGLSVDLQRLGAPGPENLSAPIVRGNPNGSGTINPSLIDRAVASSLPPNRERVTCPTPGTCGPNQEFGTIDIRRRFTNNTGIGVTRLRFRIMDISTFPNGPGLADLRALTSPDVMVTVTGGGTVMVRGTTLEEDTSDPNLGQPMGGGYNSSLSAGVITLATPLNPGASVNMRFVFGVEGLGKFRVFVVVEALP